MKTTVSVSDLCVTSFLRDSQQTTDSRDDFTFFPDIIGGFSSNGQIEKLGVTGDDVGDFLSVQTQDQAHNDSRLSPPDVCGGTESEPSNLTCIDVVTYDSGGNVDGIWDWESDLHSQNFDERLLEILGDQSELNINIASSKEDRDHSGHGRGIVDPSYYVNHNQAKNEEYKQSTGKLVSVKDYNELNKVEHNAQGEINSVPFDLTKKSQKLGILKQKAPKKRMLEISASASLRAEAVAKSKELLLQARREMAKRTRIRRRKPKKRRVVVEQKLVELIRMIRMCKRVRAEATEFLSANCDNKITIIISQKLRVVSLAMEAFLNSFMFVQPSDHEYIFQLVRPVSESCTLSVPALASLVTEAKNVLPFVVNTLPLGESSLNLLMVTIPLWLNLTSFFMTLIFVSCPFQVLWIFGDFESI